jgi:hypothetical protein
MPKKSKYPKGNTKITLDLQDLYEPFSQYATDSRLSMAAVARIVIARHLEKNLPIQAVPEN